MKYGNIYETKRRRTADLDYIHIYDEREIENVDFEYGVYCYETGLLIVCSMGDHFLAIKEHIADLLERKGLRTFEENESWFCAYEDFNCDEIEMLDSFIRDELAIYGTSFQRDFADVAF